jgi:hypothetical protein
MESVGFKEWALVCEALGRGDQTVILRKGGIAEGRDGFAFRHREFFLLPTFFHGQVERVRTPGAEIPAQHPGQVEIRFFAKVEEARFVTDWATAAALEPLHILNANVVRERFEYEGQRGIHAAFVRVFRLKSAWRFADERRYGGCRSWLQLPDPPQGMQLEPVLPDAESAVQFATFRAIADSAPVGSAER